MASAARPRVRAPASKGKRNHLRVITGGRAGGSKAASRPSSRPGLKFGAAAAIVLAAFVFGLVLLHILLAQSAFRLQGLQDEVRLQEARFRDMRYRVASEEAPARISEAAEGIGLVVPAEQRYLLVPDETPGGE